MIFLEILFDEHNLLHEDSTISFIPSLCKYLLMIILCKTLEYGYQIGMSPAKYETGIEKGVHEGVILGKPRREISREPFDKGQ